ncbi:SBDS family ribosome assembly factor, partial [Bacteroidota bacterium]
VQHLGEIKKEQWMNDGSWFAVVEIPAGLQNEFFDELNKETHGNIETKIISEG